jgi:hypothetical protein
VTAAAGDVGEEALERIEHAGLDWAEGGGGGPPGVPIDMAVPVRPCNDVTNF